MGASATAGTWWKESARRVGAARFFRALTMLCPPASVLVIEGGRHPPTLRRLLEDHAAAPEVTVPRGTAWPRSAQVHLPISEELLAAIASECELLAEPEVCDHLHVLQADAWVVQWYDAFASPMWISKIVPESAVEEFCSHLELAQAERVP